MNIGNIILSLLQFLGSVGLFIFGMRMLSSGLQKAAGKKMERILHMMTGHRLFGILTGIAVTAIIQSSSATTVMVVGFANAGMLTLSQAISVIMGANIGTTMTAWIVSVFGFKFNLTLCAFVLLFIAFPLQFSKNSKIIDLSDVFNGLAVLFIGLNFISNAIPSVDNNVGLFSFTQSLNNPTIINMLICTLIGMLVTGVIQSSSAAMALTITLAFKGWIGPYAAAALCLGQNIGTTITAILSSIGANSNARKAAMAHLLFNVVGSVLALIFLKPLMHFVNALTATDIFSATGPDLHKDLPFFLSMFHTVFNVMNTLIFFPFVKQFAAIINKLVKDDTKVPDKKKKYIFSIEGAISSSSAPDLYLGAVRDEIAKLGDLALNMIKDFKYVVQNPDVELDEIVTKMKDDEDYADDMQEVLTGICVRLMQQSPSNELVNSMTCFIRGIDEMESITDSCYSLVCDAKKRRDKGFVFTEEAQSRIIYYVDMVTEYLSYINEHIQTPFTQEELMKSYDYENKINKERASLVNYVEKRMKTSSDNIQKELLLFDMTRALEHIGDFCTNIAQTYSKESRSRV